MIASPSAHAMQNALQNLLSKWSSLFFCLLAGFALSGGHRQVIRSLTTPFACTSEEEGYRIAWNFFEGQADHPCKLLYPLTGK